MNCNENFLPTEVTSALSDCEHSIKNRPWDIKKAIAHQDMQVLMKDELTSEAQMLVRRTMNHQGIGRLLVQTVKDAIAAWKTGSVPTAIGKGQAWFVERGLRQVMRIPSRVLHPVKVT